MSKTTWTPDRMALLRNRLARHYIVDSSGCWLWTGSQRRGGYGQITFQQVNYLAHRAALIANGVTVDGSLVCHTCDVRACVNPAHLYVGTFKDNRRDMLERSGWRHPYGQRDACTKGHSYSNGFRIAKDGSRVCRTCMRDHMRNFRERSKARGN